jgi:hypothetical protein
MNNHTTAHFLYDISEGRHPGENFVFEKDKRTIGSIKIFENKERWIPSLQFIFFEDKYRSRMTNPSLSQNLRYVKNCGVV